MYKSPPLPPQSKSNLNISNTSELHSSLLSSVYGEKTLTESIQKINQLKQIYKQTCNQQEQLDKQKDTLTTKLNQLKNKIESIILEKFGTTNHGKINYRKSVENRENSTRKNQRIYKPGSINKTNKNINIETRQKQPKLTLNTLQNHQELLLPNNDQKIPQNNTQLHLNFPTQFPNFLQSSKSQKPENIDHKKASFNIWSNDRPKFENIPQQNQHQIKKSYLSSPRGNSLISPRNYVPA